MQELLKQGQLKGWKCRRGRIDGEAFRNRCGERYGLVFHAEQRPGYRVEPQVAFNQRVCEHIGHGARANQGGSACNWVDTIQGLNLSLHKNSIQNARRIEKQFRQVANAGGPRIGRLACGLIHIVSNSVEIIPAQRGPAKTARWSRRK